MKGLIWVTLCIFVVTANVVAAEGEESYIFSYREPEEPARVNLAQVFGQMFVSLVVVLVLFYILARLLKSRCWGGLAITKHLEITDRLSLGANRELYIIRLGKQFLLLGVTNNTINLLQEITNQETLTNLRKTGSVAASFDEILASQGEGENHTLAALEAKLSRIAKGGNEGDGGRG